MSYNTGSDFSVRRTSTTEQTRLRMLYVFLRDQHAFEQACEQLEPVHLESAGDSCGAVLWEAARYFAEANGGLLIPNQMCMMSELSLMRDDNDLFLSGNVDETQIEDMVEKIYSWDPPTAEMIPVANNDCRVLLLEHHQKELHEQLDGEYNTELLDIIRNTEDHICNATTFGVASDSFMLADADWRLQPVIDTKPLGIGFLDDCLNGGDMPGEVNAFMAPFGTCKTTLACMLAVESASNALARHQQETGSVEGAPLVVLVTWEDRKTDIFHRCMARCADVSWTDIQNRTLSTPDDLKLYELMQLQRAMRVNPNAQIICEEKRLEEAYNRLSLNVRVIDFEGSTEACRPHMGDMAKGLEIMMRRLARQHPGRAIERVIIDHASAAAKAYSAKHEVEMDKVLRHLLNMFPRELRIRIAQPYNCPVWVMHQLGTAAVSKGPGRVPSMTDCAESRSFVEFITNAFATGSRTAEGLVAFGQIKHRRSGGQPPRILRIDGARQTLEDVSDRYELAENQIVSSGEARRVSANSVQGVNRATSAALFDDDVN